MYRKQTLGLFLCLLTVAALAQTPYEILQERPNEKTYKGWLTRALLEQESSFTWMQENYKAYQPHAAGLQTLRQYKDSVRFLVLWVPGARTRTLLFLASLHWLMQPDYRPIEYRWQAQIEIKLPGDN